VEAMKAVVLAGGKGTRLAPYTKILPKPLMPIGDMPILEVLLRQMKRSGIDEVFLTVGHLAGLLRAFFQDGQQLGLKIHYSYECQPLGTAGPLSLLSGLDETFFVTNGDVLTTLDYSDLLDFHRSQAVAATIAAHIRTVNINLGVIQTNSRREIINYIEKPSYEYLVSMGVYIFEPRVLSHINYNQYLDFPDLILKMIAAGEKVMSYPYDGYWMDLGRVDDYEQALKDFEVLKPRILGEESCQESLASGFLTPTGVPYSS
jgi:NDP-sugar pyrophosphorylase family protein